MREYETTIIIQPEISEEGSAAILSRLDGLLESNDATRLMCDDLGKRKLAYEINKFHKGHYYMLSYLNDGKVVPEIERVLRLDESVLRFLTIQADDEVADIEARTVECRELEEAQAKRAAEKATRDAEDERERREADLARAAEEEARTAAAAKEQASAEADEPASEDSPESAAAVDAVAEQPDDEPAAAEADDETDAREDK